VLSDVAIVLLIVLVAVLVVRGPKMLPRLGEAFGRGVRDARKEVAKGFGGRDDSDDPGTPTA
jgi:Sec-independent protein translocase protein TatA